MKFMKKLRDKLDKRRWDNLYRKGIKTIDEHYDVMMVNLGQRDTETIEKTGNSVVILEARIANSLQLSGVPENYTQRFRDHADEKFRKYMTIRYAEASR
jgi:RNA binding exosome subunit